MRNKYKEIIGNIANLNFIRKCLIKDHEMLKQDDARFKYSLSFKYNRKKFS